MGAELPSRLVVESYDVELDLQSPASECFRSRTLVRIACEQSATISTDLAASSIESVALNGDPLPVSNVWDGARFELNGLAPSNVLEVDGFFPYAIEDRGLRRSQDPDGTTYVYSAIYPESASRVFCCIDAPGSRAQISVSLSVPPDWACLMCSVSIPES